MTQAKTSKTRRNSDLAMIHMAAKKLPDDSRDFYEDWVERHTGKRSAGKLTAPERAKFIKALRKDGLIPDRQQGGRGATRDGIARPSAAQWGMIGGLARSMGWENGLEDARLRGFVLRTVKVSQPKFITAVDANNVITGLQKYKRQQDAKQAKANAVP